nr:E3 ubiquitin-protein ligase RNF13-like isoform X1 [Cherax quadricarinatus]
MEVSTRQRMLFVAAWMLIGLAHKCQADVIIISTLNNKTFTAVGDLPALFGPPIPLTGFKGYAQYVMPPDACTKLHPPPKLKNITGPWIGIVKRYNCAFVEKVLNAQIAGYDAVIVHNVGSNSIQPMGSDNQSLSEKVSIPSVFIGQEDAFMIIENFLYDKGYILEITDDLPFNLQNYLVPFAITIGICFIVMLTFMVVKCVRDYRRSRRHRLSSRSLKKLPVHKFKKGDPYECCAICLEDYVDNDKLRILPCEHAYHTKCIDPWLTKNRRVCPVCKRKVFTGDERPSDLETDSEDENSPLINSEGGTQGGTFDSQRENPFQEAQRQAEERRRRRRRRRSVSRNVECGPEGYQRLADSTDDEEEEEEENEESAVQQRSEDKNEDSGKN